MSFLDFLFLGDLHRELRAIATRLDRIEEKIDSLSKKENAIMAETKEMSDLIQEVFATRDVEASALAAIHGLLDQLVAAGTDPAKLKTLTDGLRASAEELAAAVALVSDTNEPLPVVP